jgi:hypothetical protein
LDEIQTKDLRVFLLAIHSHFYRNPHRNLKTENSQEYDQKPQRNCTFMNSASVRSVRILKQDIPFPEQINPFNVKYLVRGFLLFVLQ